MIGRAPIPYPPPRPRERTSAGLNEKKTALETANTAGILALGGASAETDLARNFSVLQTRLSQEQLTTVLAGLDAIKDELVAMAQGFARVQAANVYIASNVDPRTAKAEYKSMLRAEQSSERPGFLALLGIKRPEVQPMKVIPAVPLPVETDSERILAERGVPSHYCVGAIINEHGAPQAQLYERSIIELAKQNVWFYVPVENLQRADTSLLSEVQRALDTRAERINSQEVSAGSPVRVPRPGDLPQLRITTK